jgi:hypothetical protein
MEEWLKLFAKGLTSLPNMDKITISETDLLKIHNESLAGYSDGYILDLLTKNPKFQSVHDKFVGERLSTQKGDLTKTHDDLLQEKEDLIIKLKASVTLPDTPDEIKKRLEIEKDPNEKRYLELLYRNALSDEKYATLEADAQKSKKIASDAELLKELNEHIKDKKYIINDPSAFLQYGENAKEKLTTFGDQLNETLNEQVAAIAKEKFRVNPGELGNKKPANPNALTQEQIEEQFPGPQNQMKRLELYKENDL